MRSAGAHVIDGPLIPVEIAHQILATFGINQPTPLYERRVKPGGFQAEDLREVLRESRFVFTIDWRAALPEELPPISAALGELGAQLRIEVPADADEGYIACGTNRQPAQYVASKNDDFRNVIVAIQRVLPASIEFRESVDNGQSDTWTFAVLLRDEWRQLEALDGEFIKTTFRPLIDRSRHFSRDPWWVVPLAGAIAALLPLWRYGSLQSYLPGIGLAEAMAVSGGLGLLASALLVFRSHVSSPFWASVVLWLGILIAGLGVSAFLAFATR